MKLLKPFLTNIRNWYPRVRFSAPTLISILLLFERAINPLDKIWKIGGLI